ncbi:hypothetical protein LY76DRAFT_604970 [Colletotrichum caudatum]|nr:hypothetical protein LY76DRAFT_604970 [Colletotrichum caudatum]
MNGYYRETAGFHPPGNDSVGYYHTLGNEAAVYDLDYHPGNEVVLPVTSQIPQQRSVLPEPNRRPPRLFPPPGISPAEPRVSSSGDGIHLPRLGSMPAAQIVRVPLTPIKELIRDVSRHLPLTSSQELARNVGGHLPLSPVQELIRDVDEHFGPPWNQRTRSDAPCFQGPGSRNVSGDGGVDSLGRLDGATSFIETVFLHRSKSPGLPFVTSNGTMRHASETIRGQLVEYLNAGPPVFHWDEVRPEAGYAWDGHAAYAGYHDRMDEQEEVPADDGRHWFLIEDEPDHLVYEPNHLVYEPKHLVYEQWHYQNPPPESQYDNQQDLQTAVADDLFSWSWKTSRIKQLDLRTDGGIDALRLALYCIFVNMLDLELLLCKMSERGADQPLVA